MPESLSMGLESNSSLKSSASLTIRFQLLRRPDRTEQSDALRKLLDLHARPEVQLVESLRRRMDSRSARVCTS